MEAIWSRFMGPTKMIWSVNWRTRPVGGFIPLDWIDRQRQRRDIRLDGWLTPRF